MKKILRKNIYFALTIFMSGLGLYALMEPGETAVPVVISEKEGGYAAGGSWDSTDVIGKSAAMFFYVDPDNQDDNLELEKALNKLGVDKNIVKSVAVVNAGATWKPAFIIGSVLKSKQEKYPDTIYVMDNKKVLEKKWGLSTDAYVVMLFGKDGKVLFRKDGQLTAEEIEIYTKKVQELLDKKSS